ncbi:MAG TPA: GAF domain-containing protein [Elusimicrobiota bacterium]|nr:GAF domain-containing protein [Elusimicrobiota bacterium]
MSYPSIEDELRALRNQWKENLDQLHLLYALSKEIVFARDLDLLFDHAVMRAAQVLKAEAASLYLLNQEDWTLDFTIVKGQSSEAIRNLNIHLRPGEGVAGWVAANGKSVISNNPIEDSRFKQDVDLMTGFQTRHIVAAPLIAQGKTLGVIQVLNKHDRKGFTEQDATFLESIAWLVAMALDNAQTYAALQASQDYQINILENLPGGFIGMDVKGRITHCNTRATEILGIFRDTCVGHHFKHCLTTIPVLMGALEKALEENKGVIRQSGDVLLPWKGRCTLGYSTLIIRDRRGETQGIGIIFQDITGVASQ